MQAGSKASLPVLFSLFGTLLYAQSTTQSMYGIVDDSASAPLYEATVTVNDLSTNVLTSTTTNESGNLTNLSVSKANEKGSL
jgi:hypothetical protein